jgi:bacteriocin biosynthesis cyclodehydratase domain-containing protein
MRPLLRPGTHVLRRADGSFQLGLDPARAVVVEDSPALRGLMPAAPATTDPTTDLPAEAHGRGLLDLIEAESMLVDERVLMPLVAGNGGPRRRIPRAAGAALARDAGHEAGVRAVERSRCRVETVAFGPPDTSALTGELEELLSRSGLSTPGRPVPAADGTRQRRRVLGALVGVGEPERELTDAWLRDQIPHIVVRMTEGRAVVGPFVVPGRTSCLRCLDAHHTDADPEWPLLVRQYAAAASRDRADGVPEPVDPALASLAVAWAARDVASYVDGVRPSTWSATLVLGSDLSSLETHSWLRHPECACSWG